MATAGKGFVPVAREPPMQFVLNEIANPGCGKGAGLEKEDISI